MTSVPHTLGEQQATVPRIVLPITSRGLVLTDRLCRGILAVAMAIAAGLILYLNRGTTFNPDELYWLLNLSVADALEPFNGNLVAPTRLLYQAIVETLGTAYLPFRLLGVAAVLLCGGLIYALVKRRIGALPALAPTLVLLFFGSASQYIVVPIGFTALISIAAGLGALLALERGDRPGDLGTCALLCVSVVMFGTGLAFLVGVAISVLIRPDRRRRAWIFLIPLVIYAAWWVSTLDSVQSGDQQAKLSNALLIPNYLADSLAAVIAALAGLDYDFTASGDRAVELEWGRVLAVPVILVLALRVRRSGVPASLWASGGIVLTFWVLGALVISDIRPPGLGRFVYMGAVGVLLVAADAGRGIRFSKLGVAALFAAATASIATNVALLRDGAASFREYSAATRAQFAMLDLARERVSPDFSAQAAAPDAASVGVSAGPYLDFARRHGSLGFSPSDLPRQGETVRQGADQILAGALGLHLERSRAGRPAGCRSIRADEPGGIGLELPPGGATLRARGAAPAKLSVGRFASSPSVELGRLAPGEAETLRIPTDASSTPWRASIEGPRSVEVCAPGSVG